MDRDCYAEHARYVAVPDAVLCCRDAGSGPCIVLVHGWLLDHTLWDFVAARLARDLRIVRWDRRGCGRSTGVPSLHDDAIDVIRVLDRLEIGRATIVGMSQGARIALQVACTAAERLDCLVLDGAPAIDGLPGGPWERDTPLEEYRALLQERGIEALRARLASHPITQLCTQDPIARDTVAAMLERYSGADLANPASHVENDAITSVARIETPALIVNGEFDSAQRLRVGEALRRAIPKAQRQIVPGAGHLACIDAPEAYATTLIEFLKPHLHAWA